MDVGFGVGVLVGVKYQVWEFKYLVEGVGYLELSYYKVCCAVME